MSGVPFWHLSLWLSPPDALVLVPSVFACLSWSKDHQWVTRGEMCEDVLQTGPDAPPERTRGCVYVRHIFKCVRAPLFTATSQDTTHLICPLLAFNLPSSGFTATLGIYCCNSVYMCTYPLHQCPWVGHNLPSLPATTALPLLWTSWLAVAHLCWTHMSTHMCDAWAPPWLYPASSAPDFYWFNH